MSVICLIAKFCYESIFFDYWRYENCMNFDNLTTWTLSCMCCNITYWSSSTNKNKRYLVLFQSVVFPLSNVPEGDKSNPAKWLALDWPLRLLNCLKSYCLKNKYYGYNSGIILHLITIYLLHLNTIKGLRIK